MSTTTVTRLRRVVTARLAAARFGLAVPGADAAPKPNRRHQEASRMIATSASSANRKSRNSPPRPSSAR